MKKIVLIISAVIILIFMCSCGKEDSATTTASETSAASTTLNNKGESVEKSDFVAIVGDDVNIPDEAEGENYYIINQDSEKFGQATFKDGNSDFVLRVEDCKEFTDISGFYFNWNSVKETEVNGCKAEIHLYKTDDDNCSVIIWFDSDNNKMYSLSTDSAVTEETLIKIASEI